MTIHQYTTARAFKQAPEARLEASSTSGADFARRRQLLVFERFLARVARPCDHPKTNELVCHNGHYTLSMLAPKGVGLPYGRYPRLVLA
jgi:hypothetical protein